ncbi:MAG TPA: tetratricopeptide repeat protein [Pyrinomonadaceae bacterium]|jgi:Flp pilus assembly protein TadD
MRLLRIVPSVLACALVFCLATAPGRANFDNDGANACASISAEWQPDGVRATRAASADVTLAPLPAQQAAPAKKHENVFLRVLAAPFRALARLFSGSKKDATARRAPAAAEQPQVARAPQPESAPTPERVIANTTQTNASADAQQRARTATQVRPEIAGGNTPSFTERPAPTTPAAPASPQQPNQFTPLVEGVARDPLSQGRALLERGNTNEAIAQLSVAAITGPDLIAANNLLGLAYDRLGQHQQAQDAYERALIAAPADAATLNNLGYSLYLSDRYAQALARLKSAARLDPSNRQIANNLALVYGRLNKFDDAYKQFARAGGEFYARVQTGALLENAGRDLDAIKQFETARRLDPASAEVLRRLINLYVRTGQPGKAEDARRLLEKMPDNKRADGATSSSSV